MCGGIILCKEENKAVVEFTLPEDNKGPSLSLGVFSHFCRSIIPSNSKKGFLNMACLLPTPNAVGRPHGSIIILGVDTGVNKKPSFS
jgi:hypothetical protein